MSFLQTLDGLVNKGKAKLKEFTDQPSSSSYNNAPPPVPAWNRPPQAPQQQQWYNQAPPPPPQQQWHNQAPPPPPQQPQWYNPPPPIPTQTHPSNAAPQPQTQPQPYWQPHFDPSVPVSTHFIQETGDHGWGNNESQNYTSSPANSFFTPHNQLVLRAIVNTNAPHDKYTSARLNTHQKLSRPRGFLTATLRAPCATGIWPAFWLLPAEPFTWPNDGEVDIFESWNGDCVNHSCLHWGHFNGEDWNKHRVMETDIPSMPQREVQVGFAWMQDEDRDGAPGKMIWYLDGRIVMRADIPAGTRRLSDFRVIINVAMGGNVCAGKLPADGSYDFVIMGLSMWDAPFGGWEGFQRDFSSAREGKTM